MSQIVPPGHHVHVPPEAEVVSMGASSLPPIIRQVLFPSLGTRPRGNKNRKKRTVICVFPVNIVKTVQCKETSFLELLIPNLPLEESSDICSADAKATKKLEPWLISKACKECGSVHSEAPLALQVSSSNHVFSDIKKYLAHASSIENSFRNMVSLCSRRTSAKKMSPDEETILVICEDFVYIAGTDFTDWMSRESEKAKSSNIMSQVEIAVEIHEDISASKSCSKVVDTVSCQKKAIHHATLTEQFTNSGICQTKKSKRIILSKAITPCSNQESEFTVQSKTNKDYINSGVKKFNVVKSCTALGLEEGRTTLETKQRAVKKVKAFSVTSAILKKSKLLHNKRQALNKSETNTQKDLETSTAFPHGYKVIRKNQDILTNAKRNSKLPKLHKTYSLTSNLQLNVPILLNQELPNQRKLHALKNSKKSKKIGHMEECNSAEIMDNAKTFLPMRDLPVTLHTNVRQQQDAEDFKRKSKLLVNTINAKKRKKNVDDEMLNSNIETALSSMQNFSSQSTPILKLLTVDLKAKILKSQAKLSDIMVENVHNLNTLKMKDLSDMASYTGPWKDATQQIEKHAESASNLFPTPLTEVDEDIRSQRIQRLKERLSEQKRALEAMKKTM